MELVPALEKELFPATSLRRKSGLQARQGGAARADRHEAESRAARARIFWYCELYFSFVAVGSEPRNIPRNLRDL